MGKLFNFVFRVGAVLVLHTLQKNLQIIKKL